MRPPASLGQANCSLWRPESDNVAEFDICRSKMYLECAERVLGATPVRRKMARRRAVNSRAGRNFLEDWPR